ncbi:hypothetical protein LVJ94_31845 [Pendulispora rubella]|uniref:Knr4/Smi1-like domain-containing protein n=1 Tax=Pendulispora rubella TaxID=2741070 RepID=A0ABZ2KX06_9BACT
MIATERSDDIKDFIDFLERIVGQEVARDRAGADPREIERLTALARLPLPPLYLEYLREFGANDGIVKLSDDASSKPEALIDYYLEQADSEESEIPPNMVIVGVNGSSGERALLYSDEARKGTEEPSVVVSWWGEVDYTLALSFRNFLYRKVFANARLKRGTTLQLQKNDGNLVPSIRRATLELGFQPYWFSDDCQTCLEREDDSALLARTWGESVSVYGSFADSKIRDEVKLALMQRLDLTE